jgi:hypothetical protein
VRIYAITIFAAVAVGGCAGMSAQRPLQVQADALYDRNIVVVRQAPPALGGAGIEEDLVETYRLADPAARIGRGLAISLATTRGMIVLSTGGSTSAEADGAALAAANPNADYVLDVSTVDWGFDNFSGARNRYKLHYAAQLRLIDKQGETVATSRCDSEQGDADNPASREDLLAQDAALVKGYLDLATARCIEHAARNMLGLRDPEAEIVSTRGQPIRIPPPREAVSLAARPPVNAPMPSVHDFFDTSAAAAPLATPTVMATARPVATPSAAPRPRPTPQPTATPTPTAIPSAQPTPAPRRAEALAVAPTPMPTPMPTPVPTQAPAAAEAPAEDELLDTDRLSAAARASGEVVELLADTPFRDSPRLTTRINRTLPTGTEVVVRQRVYNAEGEWWFIIIPGDIGWIRSPDPIPYGSPRTGTDTR